MRLDARTRLVVAVAVGDAPCATQGAAGVAVGYQLQCGDRVGGWAGAVTGAVSCVAAGNALVYTTPDAVATGAFYRLRVYWP